MLSNIDDQRIPVLDKSEAQIRADSNVARVTNEAVLRFIHSGYMILDHEIITRVDGETIFVDINYIKSQRRGAIVGDKGVISITYVFLNGKFNRVNYQR